MVYNTIFTPTDTANIFQDMFATFLQQGIVYAGLIVLVVLAIILIRSFRSK